MPTVRSSMNDLRRFMDAVAILTEEVSISDATQLNNLRAQLATAMARWDEIAKMRPQSRDTGKGYHVHTDDSLAFSQDPERGRFWELNVYPLNQQIEQLEAKIKREQRMGLLHAKAGTVVGFNTSEVLFHGTNADFETFDRAKGRTAEHIYTSPDQDTAEKYGDKVYAVYGRQAPQADLTADNSDYLLVRRIHRYGGFKRGWDLSTRQLAELIFDAELYNYSSSSRLQDEVIGTCFDLKYRSVRISDGKPSGGYSDSVIFDDPADLQIIERVE
jgi:hypothetical protein